MIQQVDKNFLSESQFIAFEKNIKFEDIKSTKNTFNDSSLSITGPLLTIVEKASLLS